jgi:hypothetical protein
LVRYGDVISSASNGTRKLLHKLDLKNYARSKNIYLSSNRPLTEFGEEIEFHLFDGHVVKGIVNHIVNRGGVTATWSGALESVNATKKMDSSHDWFTLSCHMDACVAHLVLESTSQNYIIHPTVGAELTPSGAGQYSLSEIGNPLPTGTFVEKSHLKNYIPAHIHEQQNMMTDSVAVAVDTDLIVDIGVIYTPQALASLGNR